MKKQAGFLNILTVGIVIIMGLLSAALVNMIMSSNEASINIQAGNRAYDLANAAVEVGLNELKTNPAICTGALQVQTPLTTGEYQYSCLPYLQETTLNGAILNTATSLTLSNATGFAPFGYIGIEREIIYYNSVSGNVLSGLRRGMQGTTAAGHASLVTVAQNEFVVTGQGAAPSIASPSGFVTIQRAAIRTGDLFAADTQGVIYSYNGTSWTQTTSVTTANQINGISCSGSTDCWGVGNGGNFYRYVGPTWATSGLTWTTSTVGALNVNSVSCSNASNCIAVGDRTGNNAGRAYAYNGTTWSASSVAASGPATGNGDFNAISCAAANNCWAGNSATDMYPYTGAWGTGSSRTQPVTGLSCASTTSCQGVSSNRATFSYNGTWSNNITPNGTIAGENFTVISCPTTTYCVASSTRPRTYVYTGDWGALVSITPPAAINRLSCLAAGNCVGGGTTGQFYSFNGTTWTATQKPTINSITAMSPPISGTVTPSVTPINVQS